MKRCPVCNSEMIIEDTHIITVKYKIVGDKRGKNCGRKRIKLPTLYR